MWIQDFSSEFQTMLSFIFSFSMYTIIQQVREVSLDLFNRLHTYIIRHFFLLGSGEWIFKKNLYVFKLFIPKITWKQSSFQCQQTVNFCKISEQILLSHPHKWTTLPNLLVTPLTHTSVYNIRVWKAFIATSDLSENHLL